MGGRAVTRQKPRRPKPVNFGKRRALRLGEPEEAAVEAMRSALADIRGVDVDDVPFSEGLRLLLTENEKAAQVLAGQPEAWTKSSTLEVPDELWDGMTDCRNRLSHAQGSLYTIMRKINFTEAVDEDQVRAAFEAVQESKAALVRMESTLQAHVDDVPDTAAAESGAQPR